MHSGCDPTLPSEQLASITHLYLFCSKAWSISPSPLLSLQTCTYTDRHVPPETTTNLLATKKNKVYSHMHREKCREGQLASKGKEWGEVGEKKRGWFPLHWGVSGDPTGRRGSSLILLLAATENSSSQEDPIKEQHVTLHETLFPKKQLN